MLRSTSSDFALARCNVDGAVDELSDFSEPVKDLIDDGRLTASQGGTLIDQAAVILRRIRQ